MITDHCVTGLDHYWVVYCSVALGKDHLVVEAFLDYYQKLLYEVRKLLRSFEDTKRVRG